MNLKAVYTEIGDTGAPWMALDVSSITFDCGYLSCRIRKLTVPSGTKTKRFVVLPQERRISDFNSSDDRRQYLNQLYKLLRDTYRQTDTTIQK